MDEYGGLWNIMQQYGAACRPMEACGTVWIAIDRYSWVSLRHIAVNLSGGQPKMY